MKYILREMAKLAMFILLWGFPLLLAYLFKSNDYLWFLIVSVIVTGMMFSHYEDLEKIDMLMYKDDSEEDE